MKFFILISSIILCQNAISSNLLWSAQTENMKYNLDRNIEFEVNNRIISLKKNSKLKLIEKSVLDMIKVHLLKYKILECNKINQESDLELINLPKDISVGVNLSKNCILEVFVELKDYESTSLFKL